jgi:hypothetical protein
MVFLVNSFRFMRPIFVPVFSQWPLHRQSGLTQPRLEWAPSTVIAAENSVLGVSSETTDSHCLSSALCQKPFFQDICIGAFGIEWNASSRRYHNLKLGDVVSSCGYHCRYVQYTVYGCRFQGRAMGNFVAMVGLSCRCSRQAQTRGI